MMSSPSVERSEFLQICAVDYGVDPDGPLAKVIDVMAVAGCSPAVMRSARSLRTQHQGARENQFVFIRKLTVEVRKTFERVG